MCCGTAPWGSVCRARMAAALLPTVSDGEAFAVSCSPHPSHPPTPISFIWRDCFGGPKMGDEHVCNIALQGYCIPGIYPRQTTFCIYLDSGPVQMQLLLKSESGIARYLLF